MVVCLLLCLGQVIGNHSFMMSNRSRQPQKISRVARSAQLAIILLGAFLAVLISGGLVGTRYIGREMDNFLPDYLELVGRGVTSPPRDYFWFLEFVYDPYTGGLEAESLATYRQSTAWRDLATSLQGAAREPLVSSVYLLTPAGDIIMGSDGETPPVAERGVFRAEEAAAIKEASAGRVARVGGETRLEDPRKRVYMPLRDERGRTVALLRLEVSPDRLRRGNVLRNRLFVGSLLASGLLLFLWLLLMQLVRRAIEAERVMNQGDRLRAMGTMTAGLAHEIRNPLGILSLQIEELRAVARGLSDDNARTPMLRIAEDMRAETKRLKTLTEQFLHFTRLETESGKPIVFPVEKCLDPLVKMWARGLDPQTRTVTCVVESPEIKMRFDEDRFRQIILNLLRNADDALGKQKGEISIRASLRQGFVEVTVRDNGPGIDPAHLGQIFDPFFTTRPEGTGLGLSLSRAFAESAGGSLTVESEHGKGALFLLRLPAAGS